jgi:hypothetical protein
VLDVGDFERVYIIYTPFALPNQIMYQVLEVKRED